MVEKQKNGTPKNFVTIDDLKANKNRYRSKAEPFYVKAWDSWIHVKQPDALPRSQFEEQFVGDKRSEAIRWMKIDACFLVMCDEDGKALFSTIEEARETLGDMDGNAISEISKKGEELMGISKKDIDEAIENF